MSTFAIFSKPLTSFSMQDFQTILDEEVPESALIEFKREPPGGSWTRDQTLNNDARDGLLKEIVAFSNSFGGTLFVGIDETEDEPKRAAALAPVAKVGELATRLERVMRDCIDPQLIAPQVVPFVINQNSGEGIVMVRVQPSPTAPHWNKSSRRCHKRIGTDSMEIGMLDMQGLTLDRARTSEASTNLFAKRQESSPSYLDGLRESLTRNIHGWHPELDYPAGFLLRCTAVATMPIRVADPVSQRRDLRRGTRPVMVEPLPTSGRNCLSWYGNDEPNLFTPALREWRFEHLANSPSLRHSQLVTMGGLIESRYAESAAIVQGNLRTPAIMQIEFLLTMIASMLYQVESFRRRTGYDGLPFEMEVEVLARGTVDVLYLHNEVQPGGLRFIDDRTLFPRYLIQSADTFGAAFELIQHDIYNAMGRRLGQDAGIEPVRLDEDRMAPYLTD